MVSFHEWMLNSRSPLIRGVRLHMIIRILTLSFFLYPVVASAQDASPKDAYESRIADARIAYRKAIAKQIRNANTVDLVLLRFDDVSQPDPFGDDGDRFPVAPYNATTSIISTKRLNPAQSKPLLLALANQIEKETHSGGAFCHYPVHGIRVYSKTSDAADRAIVYSGSFCWFCKNFGFPYPDNAEWLDTNVALHDLCNKLLPIPKKELDRFKAEFKTKPKVEP